MYKTLYKKMIIILTLIISLFMITACSGVNENVTEESENSGIEDTENQDHESTEGIYDIDQENQRVEITKLYDDEANYDSTSIIIKLKKSSLSDERSPEIDNDLEDLGIEKLTYLLDTSTDEFEDTGIWFNALLNEGIDSKSIIEEINQLDIVELVELNYVYENEAIDFPKVIDNPRVQEQWYLKNAGVQDAWYWLEQEGYEPGGSSSVVIAVIDTGVDYNHIDLAANMWVNPNEIPNNGIDDDGNGFIDDVHGVNVVSDERFHSGDPMDDHGHGTHVAGIAAAANNKEGIVGVAYNSKIMAIKAGNASGYFLQTDIAEAILYAYDHGADVINMSFGGTTVSNLVQDALAVAYTRSVLVASAGNDGAPNQGLGAKPNYPAAYSYVIGVMSISQNNIRSGFSNYDGIPFNYIEYEMYAPGEGIVSTLPNGQYASWSGTSMAAPIVAGTAALLRSYYSDRDMYPNKFIMGQLAGTVDMDVIKFVMPDGTHILDNDMGRLNVLSALMTEPKPNVKFYDYYVMDNLSISDYNNYDGVIDAGELINLGINVRNRWGMAKDVTISVSNDSQSGIDNPYIDIITNDIVIDSVGTYSHSDNGLIIENDMVVGISEPVQIQFSPDTPNDMRFDLTISFSYKNGLDENDQTTYFSSKNITLEVRNGELVPDIIDQDMTLTNDTFWIVQGQTLIKSGVTVTVEPGAKIQFWSAKDDDYYDVIKKTSLIVDGELNIIGEANNLIEIFPSQLHNSKQVEILKRNNGVINIMYANITNANINVSSIKFSRFDQSAQFLTKAYNRDGWGEIQTPGAIVSPIITDSYFYKLQGNRNNTSPYFIVGELQNNIFDSTSLNIVLGNTSVNDIYNVDLYLNINTTESMKHYGNVFINGKYTLDSFSEKGFYYSSNQIFFYEPDVLFYNNIILNNSNYDSLDEQIKIFAHGYSFNRLTDNRINSSNDYSNITNDINSNYFGNNHSDLIDLLIYDLSDNLYSSDLLTNNTLQVAPSSKFPYVTNAFLLNENNERVNKVGNETVTFVVEFNQNMDTSIPLDVRFGSSLPYAEYQIDGDYVSPTRWEGVYTFKTIIENRYQYWNISNGQSAEDSWYQLPNDVMRFKFEIDTTAAQALIMQGSANEEGINLSWMQDDFETLAGYNVYRSNSEDGFYQRLNDSIIPIDTKSFFDDTVEPGVTYYYNFTVVKTDLSESIPSGKIVIQSLDTMAPNIYHTPVYETFINQNLLIRANIIDNLFIQSAKVYYRTVGQTEWNVANMTANNDQYSVVIPSSALSLNGLEYYIEAYDGISYTYKGIDSDPHQVVVKNAIDENAYGDVNGDGVITVLDALMLLQAINDRINLTSDQFLRADLNENGVLEAWEALRILQYTSGKVTTIR